MKRTVLLLEDDLALAREILDGLAKYGYETDHAAEAEEALLLFKNRRHDAVVADLILRSEDSGVTAGGTGLLQRIRLAATVAGRPPPPLLLISGAQAVVDNDLVWSSTGADRLLRKPFTIDQLVAAIEELASW